MRVLPILFSTEMVRAILTNKKTVTRRVVKGGVWCVLNSTYREEHPGTPGKVLIDKMFKPPYRKGDVLYVRETWSFLPCVDCTREGTDCGRACVTYEDKDSISDGCFVYRADHPNPDRVSWSPSIHMPKAAARIWIKVTDIKAERLQDIDDDGIVAEGLEIGTPFEELWDATIKKSDRARYGWDANPWVWVIEFERCEKTEGNAGQACAGRR